MNEIKLHVGQTVYAYIGRVSGLSILTVTKVGRKWVELNNGRYRSEVGSRTIDGKGYSSPGRLYLSEAEYQEEKTVNEVWKRFHSAIQYRYSPPTGVTQTDIETAARCLKLEMK